MCLLRVRSYSSYYCCRAKAVRVLVELVARRGPSKRAIVVLGDFVCFPAYSTREAPAEIHSLMLYTSMHTSQCKDTLFSIALRASYSHHQLLPTAITSCCAASLTNWPWSQEVPVTRYQVCKYLYHPHLLSTLGISWVRSSERPLIATRGLSKTPTTHCYYRIGV